MRENNVNCSMQQDNDGSTVAHAVSRVLIPCSTGEKKTVVAFNNLLNETY